MLFDVNSKLCHEDSQTNIWQAEDPRQREQLCAKISRHDGKQHIQGTEKRLLWPEYIK